jgi:hypothetical protein
VGLPMGRLEHGWLDHTQSVDLSAQQPARSHSRQEGLVDDVDGCGPGLEGHQNVGRVCVAGLACDLANIRAATKSCIRIEGECMGTSGVDGSAQSILGAELQAWRPVLPGLQEKSCTGFTNAGPVSMSRACPCRCAARYSHIDLGLFGAILGKMQQVILSNGGLERLASDLQGSAGGEIVSEAETNAGPATQRLRDKFSGR